MLSLEDTETKIRYMFVSTIAHFESLVVYITMQSFDQVRNRIMSQFIGDSLSTFQNFKVLLLLQFYYYNHE